MSEVAEQVAEKKVKKVVAAPAAVKKTKPNHPPTAEMVDAAIGALKERGGSSVLAIKKYVTATYKVDVEKLAPYIKKYIKGAVIKGHLLQTKGKGASGSFKLSVKPKSSDKPKKTTATAAKPKAAKKPPQAGEKKPKKSVAVAAKKDHVVKVAGGTKKSGTVVKAKPAAAAKPKKAAPAPKTAAPKAKKPAAKKVSAKK